MSKDKINKNGIHYKKVMRNIPNLKNLLKFVTFLKRLKQETHQEQEPLLKILDGENI